MAFQIIVVACQPLITASHACLMLEKCGVQREAEPGQVYW
jgi:hypothetical protein